MADSRYDVIVVGAGAMGSAVAWWLTRRGRSVLLLDRYPAGHGRGSSHGPSRIFRLGYPDARYAALAVEARQLWRDLETVSGARLLEPSGSLDHGPAEEVEPIARVYDELGLPHDVLGAGQAADRWPGMRFDGDVLHQPDGAVIRADRVLEVLHEQVRTHGGTLAMDSGRAAVERSGNGVLVRAGDLTATAPVAVVAAGPWAAPTLADLVDLPDLTVTREQVLYFRPASDIRSWPCFVDRRDPARFGLATPGRGIKVGEHHTGAPVSADGRSFDCDDDGRQRVVDYVRRWLPGLDPEPTSYETCLYTSTPTEDFVVKRDGALVVAAGFSGHGFKFTPLIGRLLADAAEGEGAVPIGMWSGRADQRSGGSHL